jgi:hypothetical protein
MTSPPFTQLRPYPSTATKPHALAKRQGQTATGSLRFAQVWIIDDGSPFCLVSRLCQGRGERWTAPYRIPSSHIYARWEHRPTLSQIHAARNRANNRAKPKRDPATRPVRAHSHWARLEAQGMYDV